MRIPEGAQWCPGRANRGVALLGGTDKSAVIVPGTRHADSARKGSLVHANVDDSERKKNEDGAGQRDALARLAFPSGKPRQPTLRSLDIRPGLMSPPRLGKSRRHGASESVRHASICTNDLDSGRG